MIGFSCILLTNYFLVYIPEDIKKSTNLVVDYLSDTQNQVPLSSSSIFDHPLFNKLGFIKNKEPVLLPIFLIFTFKDRKIF